MSALEIKHYPFPPPGEPAPLEREPYPAPVLSSRDVARHPVPGPVAELRTYALDHGWTTDEPRQSIGYLPHATYGTPGKTAKTLWGLRMKRGNERAVAVRVDGMWGSFWTWSSTQFFTRHSGLGLFEEAIR